MLDFMIGSDGDLSLTQLGDISLTQSVRQAVRIRLLWFFGEWRLGPSLGFPHYENTFVKNPSEAKLKYLIRKAVMEVEEVKDVKDVTILIDKKTRNASITVVFCTDENDYREEVEIPWQSTDLLRTAQT